MLKVFIYSLKVQLNVVVMVKKEKKSVLRKEKDFSIFLCVILFSLLGYMGYVSIEKSILMWIKLLEYLPQYTWSRTGRSSRLVEELCYEIITEHFY